MSRIQLFHTGYLEIRQPDILHGRRNADFGQGFYLSPSDEFAGRWAKERRESRIIVNTYELETEGLRIKHFERDLEWFRYIFSNRRAVDILPDYDVIIGPIANDTIYDTLGIFTSGYGDKCGSTDPAEYFKSSSNSLIVALDGKEAALAERVIEVR